MTETRKIRTALEFDELNQLNQLNQLNGLDGTKAERKKAGYAPPIPIPYREFFGKMHIDPEQMEKRIALAEDIEREVLFIFAYWVIRADIELSVEQLKAELKERLYGVVESHTKMDDYIKAHIDEVADEIIDATARRDDEIMLDESMGVQSYWLSTDRAMLISENEANSIENYDEYRWAKSKGFTHKRWLTELDEKVRDTHAEIEGKVIDIDGLFLVGTSLMRFPHDVEYGADPEEIINCRCACQYEP